MTFAQLYAVSRPRVGGKAAVWHLSYNVAGHPNARTLCGNSSRMDDDRPVHTAAELEKLQDTTNRLCERCVKAGPWTPATS